MSLQTRRPPGHAKRKALAHAADIMRLWIQGHSLSAIREALEDAGLVVSISTVRREVIRGTSTAVLLRPAVTAPSIPVYSNANGAEAGSSASSDAPTTSPLPGKAIAEEFMRRRPTNPLFLKEPSP